MVLKTCGECAAGSCRTLESRCPDQQTYATSHDIRAIVRNAADFCSMEQKKHPTYPCGVSSTISFPLRWDPAWCNACDDPDQIQGGLCVQPLSRTPGDGKCDTKARECRWHRTLSRGYVQVGPPRRCISFLRIGFVWLQPQNVLRMNQRSEVR